VTEALAALLRDVTQAVSMIVGGLHEWWERRHHS
jgi:hypothetical protein